MNQSRTLALQTSLFLVFDINLNLKKINLFLTMYKLSKKDYMEYLSFNHERMRGNETSSCDRYNPNYFPEPCYFDSRNKHYELKRPLGSSYQGYYDDKCYNEDRNIGFQAQNGAIMRRVLVTKTIHTTILMSHKGVIIRIHGVIIHRKTNPFEQNLPSPSCELPLDQEALVDESRSSRGSNL